MLTDNTPPGITDEMIENGAQVLRSCGISNRNGLLPAYITDYDSDGYAENERVDDWIPAGKVVRAVLEAALAGRTVIDLPEPHAASSNEQCGNWLADGDSGAESEFAAFLHWDDASPVVEVTQTGGGTEEWGTDALRVFCLNGLAACEFADRLAAESSKGGDPHE